MGHNGGDLYVQTLLLSPCLASWEAGIHYKLPFRSEEAYSLVRVIRVLILIIMKILAKRSIITVFTAFIIAHLLYFLLTLILLQCGFLILLKFLQKVCPSFLWYIFSLNILTPVALISDVLVCLFVSLWLISVSLRLKLSEHEDGDVFFCLMIPSHVEYNDIMRSVDMYCMKAAFHSFPFFFVYSARACWSAGVWVPEWQSLCDDAGQVPHVWRLSALEGT